MRTRFLQVFFLLCFSLISQNVLSQDESNMFIHGAVGLSSLSEKNYSSGFWSGFGFSVPVQKDLFISFNFGAWKSQVSAKPDGLQAGSLRVSPFIVSLYYFPGHGNRSIYPYLFLGGGYIFTTFRMEDVLFIPEISFSQKVKNSPGGQGGAGLHYKVSKRISLFTEIFYLYNRTSGTTTLQDLNFGSTEEDFSLILSALIFQMGLKFFI